MTHKCICGGIYRFRRKFRKDSGEIKPFGVHRNIIGNWQYICWLFCWSWHKSWDNFQKREDNRKWEDWFWNSEYRHICTLVLVHKLITFLATLGGQNALLISVTSGCLLPRKICWAIRIGSFCSKLRYFTDQNIPKGDHKKMKFDHFQIQKWILQTVRAEKVDQKMESSFCASFLSYGP